MAKEQEVVKEVAKEKEVVKEVAKEDLTKVVVE